MGQMLSREDEEGVVEETTEEHAEECAERPRQRKRNVAALRSRKPKVAGQGRTRRNRANAFN